MEEQSDQSTYYSRNREKCLAQSKAYLQAHKEKYKNYFTVYYQAHKEELSAKRRAYYQKNKERISEQKRVVYYERHPPKPKKEVVQEVVEEVIPITPQEEVPRWTMIRTPGGTLTFD